MTSAQMPLICRPIQRMLIYNYVKSIHYMDQQFYLHIYKNVDKIPRDAVFIFLTTPDAACIKSNTTSSGDPIYR